MSVSLTNSTPACSSSVRSSAKFSMIPLWMTATRPAASRCGWALRSVGRPWVAQRVWPMPVVPLKDPGGISAIACLEVLQPAGTATDGEFALVVNQSDSRRVVAPVLHPAQCVHDDSAGGGLPDYPTIPHILTSVMQPE